MVAQFAFKRFEVWQKAKQFNKLVYQLTTKISYNESKNLLPYE